MKKEILQIGPNEEREFVRFLENSHREHMKEWIRARVIENWKRKGLVERLNEINYKLK